MIYRDEHHHHHFRYVTAFGELAKSSTTMLLPGNPSDVGSAVAQAMAIYGKVRVISDLLILTLPKIIRLIPMSDFAVVNLVSGGHGWMDGEAKHILEQVFSRWGQLLHWPLSRRRRRGRLDWGR